MKCRERSGASNNALQLLQLGGLIDAFDGGESGIGQLQHFEPRGLPDIFKRQREFWVSSDVELFQVREGEEQL